MRALRWAGDLSREHPALTLRQGWDWLQQQHPRNPMERDKRFGILHYMKWPKLWEKQQVAVFEIWKFKNIKLFHLAAIDSFSVQLLPMSNLLAVPMKVRMTSRWYLSLSSSSCKGSVADVTTNSVRAPYCESQRNLEKQSRSVSFRNRILILSGNMHHQTGISKMIRVSRQIMDISLA